MGLFQIEQLPLNVKAAAVSAKRAVGSNYAMARDYNRNRIAIVRHTDRAKSMRMPNGFSYVAVRTGLTIRNIEQRAPAFELKIGAAEIERESEFLPLALKVFINLPQPGLKGIV